jgi:hypothetical protein
MVVTETSVALDITPCSPLKVNGRFRKACGVRIKG